ncbi:MAG TPA: ATP-binding protein [Candidatus Udaeobacter sp.]|nr:ATP-binding protein [Candidatus Udaeobacter sp.]
MQIKTLRGKVTLWSVGVVAAGLVLFGAGAAWNLRDEMTENLDNEIKTEAHDFFKGIKQQGVDWQNPRSVEALFDQSKRYHYVEIHDASGRLLYRSPNLENQEVFPADGRQKLRDVDWNGRTLRFGVFENGGIILALGKGSEETRETLAQLGLAYLLTLPLVVVAVGVGSSWIAQRAVAPVKTIAARAEKISACDLHQRLPKPWVEDEIAHLTRVLNAMFDRLQRSFEQVTRFTSDASHELKMPLALMRAEVEMALESLGLAPAQRELLSDLLEQCTQLSQIVDGLLFLSRADDRLLALEQTSVNLVAMVRELIEDAEILAAQSTVSLECNLPAELVVPGDLRLLRRAVMNLIDNAIKYNVPDGSVVLSASLNGANALLNVGNTGAGVPPNSQDQIFHRFYRGDPSHNQEISGHGLGLSIAREIARAHGGDVTLVKSDSRWTEFALALPRETRR